MQMRTLPVGTGLAIAASAPYRSDMAGGVDYQCVFEAAHASQLLLDRDCRVVTPSDGYLRSIDRTRASIAGQSIFDLPPYAGQPIWAERLRASLDAMQRVGYPIATIAAGGLWSHAGLSTITDAAGRVEYVVHALELTAGGSEHSESDSERRLRKLIDQTYDAVALFDAHGRITYASPSIERVLGWTPEQFNELGAIEAIHPEDRAGFGAELGRLFEQPGGHMLTRFRAHHRDGHWITIENAVVNSLHDPDIAAFISTSRDVSKQVELQEELQRSHERLRIALSAARAMVWDIDLTNEDLAQSSDFATFYGLDPNQPYDDPERRLASVHPDDRELVRAASERSRATGDPFNVEFRGNPASGEPRWYASYGQVSHDESGRAVRMVGVTWDVTERQRLREESRMFEHRMQESQKLESLGVLAGGIAHDFNNLLMVILGSVSLLRRELSEAPRAVEHVAQVEEASRRAADLCRQLLAYAGKGQFQLEHVNLNRLIEETTSLLQVSVSKKAKLRLHLDHALPAVLADATQIRQVLMNLVINASDAIGDQPGMIAISTGIVHADRAYLEASFVPPDLPPGDYVYLEVSDSGAGMRAETQSRIFEPFFTTKFTGRGLGLAAVLGIVRGHRGALKVYSEIDKGSSFKLLLPATRNEANEARAPGKGDALLHAGGTILVVDDEAAIRNVMRKLLEELGFRTLDAPDGAEAIRIYREQRQHILCVLMDLTMPRLDGEEAFRELRRIDPNVRVLLMSGYNEQDAVARFVGKGIAGFIQKPFVLDDLKDQIQRLLSE